MPNAAPSFQPFKAMPRTKPDLRYLQRGGKGRLYNCRRWQRERLAFILANRTCYLCHEPIEVVNGRPVNACVDHEPPHRNDERAFWCKATWRSCHEVPCHNSKTARKDRHPTSR